MPKLHNPLFSLGASGSISRAITFLRRMRGQIAEKKPELKDVKTAAQLDWRHMFLKVVALWHALSAAEKAEWESAARPRHMTGYAWFVSQALRPNPGIYLPLQGGTMQGIIDMDGYAIQDLLDPVAVQDADTKAARDAAIAAAIGGSLTCDIHGWDTANWQKLLVESAAQHNLRVKLFDGAIGIDSFGFQGVVINQRGLYTIAQLYANDLSTNQGRHLQCKSSADGVAATYLELLVQSRLNAFNGATYDRLRSYPAGILKVGRAEVGLSDMRRVGAGQVKAAAGKLYWMTMNPTAANSVIELTDDLNGLGAIKWDMTHGVNSAHHMTLDPPLEFSTGIYLKTLTNFTSVIFGYL